MSLIGPSPRRCIGSVGLSNQYLSGMPIWLIATATGPSRPHLVDTPQTHRSWPPRPPTTASQPQHRFSDLVSGIISDEASSRDEVIALAQRFF